MDSLAARGTNFTRAYAANPVCMPNRATIMTGRWPSAHGLRTNGIPLDPSSDTFVRRLRAAGWTTAAVGKMHLQPMGYPYEDYQLDQIKAAMPELWEKSVRGPFGEDFISWEDAGRHADGDVVIPPDYYGFDEVALVCGHGDRVSGNYVRWARERGFDPRTQAGSSNSPASYEGWPGQVYASPTPADLHPTSYIAEVAETRLMSATTDDPLFLYVSFPDPHHPFTPPEEYYHRYRPEDMPLPSTFRQDHGLSPEHIRRIDARRGLPDIDPMMLWAPTEEQYRHALAAELGSIEFIDDSIARILGALEASGRADDTIVVLTSDHGDVFGDHGLMLKHFTHYRGAVRVPLIFAGIGTRGQVHELVSSADIGPTLLDLLNVEPLEAAQGRSLTPLLQGDARGWRTRLLIEEDQPYGIDGMPGPVRLRTVITDGFRMTRYAGLDEGELYDLAADPEELVNRFGDPGAATLRAQADSALVEELMRVADDSVVPFDAA